MLFFGGFFGGEANPILGPPRPPKAYQGWPRPAKAGQGWPRPFAPKCAIVVNSWSPTLDFDECFTLFAKLEPSEASWSLLLERNCRQSVMLVFGETLRGGKAHPILGRPRLAEAGQGRPRLAKAGQGWPRLAKALLLQSVQLSSTFGLRPLILMNVSHFWPPDP